MATLPESIASAVAGLYVGSFVAAPDHATAQRWADIFASLYAGQQGQPDAFGRTYREVSEMVLTEATSSGVVPPWETLTPTEQITLFYQMLLGRNPDAQGLAWWLQEIDTGAILRGDLMSYLLAAALQDGGRDAAYVQHRVAVAEQFALAPNSNPSMLAWLKYDGAAVLEGVTSDPDTMFVGISKLGVTEAPAGAWSDLTLTNAPANLGVVSHEGAWVDLLIDTSSAATVGAVGGTLTLSGSGIIYYDNNDGWSVAANDWTQNDNGKFHFIDADALAGHLILGWVGDEEHDLGVFYGGLSPRVSEMLTLATNRADVVLFVDFSGQGITSSSTLGLTDVILGFDASRGMQLVGGREPGQAYTTQFLELSDQIITREAALQTAAQAYQAADADVVFFHYVSNTYLYADTNGNGQADATDFLLTVTGVHDLAFAAELQETGWVG